MIWCMEFGRLLWICLYAYLGGMMAMYWVDHNWIHMRAKLIALLAGWILLGIVSMAWIKGWLA